MSKKFSIVRTKIDINKLLNNIEEYSIINMVNPYLFMNKDTIDELISIVGYSPDGLFGSQSNYMCGYFQGYKVFCDNTLKFGEVEIR